MDRRTSIQIYQDTLARLQKIGRFGESYDGLINRLVDTYTQHEQDLGVTA